MPLIPATTFALVIIHFRPPITCPRKFHCAVSPESRPSLPVSQSPSLPRFFHPTPEVVLSERPEGRAGTKQFAGARLIARRRNMDPLPHTDSTALQPLPHIHPRPRTACPLRKECLPPPFFPTRLITRLPSFAHPLCSLFAIVVRMSRIERDNVSQGWRKNAAAAYCSSFFSCDQGGLKWKRGNWSGGKTEWKDMTRPALSPPLSHCRALTAD